MGWGWGVQSLARDTPGASQGSVRARATLPLRRPRALPRPRRLPTAPAQQALAALAAPAAHRGTLPLGGGGLGHGRLGTRRGPRPQCPRPARRVSSRGAPVPARPAASASWAATAPSLVSGSQGEEGPTRPCPASEPAAAPRCARVPTGPARTRPRAPHRTSDLPSVFLVNSGDPKRSVNQWQDHR